MIENKQMIILGGTMDIEKVKENHMTKSYEIGEKIENYYANNIGHKAHLLHKKGDTLNKSIAFFL